MNSTLAAAWAILGLTAGSALAPATYWLAGNTHHHSRLLLGATTATTFLLTAAWCSTGYELLTHSVFAAIAVQLATIDLLVRQLPRVLIWPTCLAVTSILAADAIDQHDATRLLRAAAAAAALAGGYLTIAIASHGGLGAGDVRLAVLVGGVLGWHSWTTLITGATLGFLGTGILTIARRIPAATPHGPGMLTGAFIALLL